MTIRVPRTVAGATALLERHAQLQGEVAGIEGRRHALLARANARADTKLAPLMVELGELGAAIGAWWLTARAELAGKRKSIQLGGCMVGTRATRAKLVHSFEDDTKAVAALQASRYAKRTLSVRYSIDRTAMSRLLDQGGQTAEAIKRLGFSMTTPGDTFFIERVEQPGTIASA